MTICNEHSDWSRGIVGVAYGLQDGIKTSPCSYPLAIQQLSDPVDDGALAGILIVIALEDEDDAAYALKVFIQNHYPDVEIWTLHE